MVNSASVGLTLWGYFDLFKTGSHSVAGLKFLCIPA